MRASRHPALQSERAPWYHGAIDTVTWGSVIQFERRLARRFGTHRVWLAGDAAHVTSPLGNQSMNAGLIEAHELAHLVAKTVDSGHGLAELDDYGTERPREEHKLFGVNVGFETAARTHVASPIRAPFGIHFAGFQR